MKKLIVLIALLVLLAGGAFLFLTGDTINALLKSQIEKVGSQLTEQSVTVKNVDMKLLNGAGTINGLVLNNPKGYSTTPAFSLNEVTLDINIKSLNSSPIVIDAIVIDKPEALVEFNQTGGSNIQTILDAINKNLGSASTAPTETSGDSAPAADPKITVKKFVLAGVALEVDLTKLGNKAHKKTLPDINLANIGGAQGLPASQLGGELVKQALSSIWKAAKKQQEEILKGKLEDKAKKEVGKLFDKLNKG